MAEETLDPGVLEQTKNQIKKLVAEIAELAETDIQPGDFYVEFLNRVVSAVAAQGGALWFFDPQNRPKVQHHIEFRQTGLLDNRQLMQPHDALLTLMTQAAQPQLIPPGATVEGMPNAGNPTDLALILSPIVVEKRTVGLVEILMEPTRRAVSQKSTLRFVGDLSDLASQYLKNRQVRQMLSQQKLWNQLENFSQTIHQSLDLKETAYAVANEGKRLVGCDRLSVAMKLAAHAKVMVEAVSGQEIVEQRSNLVREMTRLCRAVIQSGEDLVYTGNTEGYPPDIRDALEVYVDESGAKAVAVTLLHKPETETDKDKAPYGCLIAEQIGDEMAPTDMHARCEVVSRHSSTALWNAQEHHKIFLLPVLKAIGSPWRFFRGRMLAKILAVLGLILGTILALTFVPWKLNIEGRGSLMPQTRRMTYAPLKGIVKELPFEHNDFVHGPSRDEQGNPIPGDIIAKLESKDLEAELQKLLAEKAEAVTQKGTLEAQIAKSTTPPDEKPRLYGELKQAEIKIEGANEQIRYVTEMLELLNVRAPNDGIVTTWKVQENLKNKPVEVGTELIQVADLSGEWVLEVNVSDHDMGPILAAESQLRTQVAPVKEAKAKLDALSKDGVSAKNAEAIEEVLDELMRTLRKAEKDGAGKLANLAPATSALTDYSKAVAHVLDGSQEEVAKAAEAKQDLDRAIDRATTLSAYFMAATDPGEKYPAYVKRRSTKAENVDQTESSKEHSTKVILGFTDDVRRDYLKRNQLLRPGAEVRAMINCGDARLAYALFRDVVAFYHENLTFRWPWIH
jgi:hypothetical protein